MLFAIDLSTIAITGHFNEMTFIHITYMCYMKEEL